MVKKNILYTVAKCDGYNVKPQNWQFIKLLFFFLLLWMNNFIRSHKFIYRYYTVNISITKYTGFKSQCQILKIPLALNLILLSMPNETEKNIPIWLDKSSSGSSKWFEKTFFVHHNNIAWILVLRTNVEKKNHQNKTAQLCLQRCFNRLGKCNERNFSCMLVSFKCFIEAFVFYPESD